MGTKTSIEWTRSDDGTPGATWNPVTGCSHVSPGCEHCYAETLSHRYKWTTQPWGARHAAENVQLHPERLDLPLRWKKPRRIFVNSMSDLFQEQVPDTFIDEVFVTMRHASQHSFQVLTKRPQRMVEWFLEPDKIGLNAEMRARLDQAGNVALGSKPRITWGPERYLWPRFKDPKGADVDEWDQWVSTAALRVREMPEGKGVMHSDGRAQYPD